MSSREKHKARSQRSNHEVGRGSGVMITNANRKTDARKKIKEIRGAKKG